MYVSYKRLAVTLRQIGTTVRVRLSIHLVRFLWIVDYIWYVVEGPMSHDQPTYASVPGIRVYGMMCVQGNRKGRQLRYTRSLSGISSLKICIDVCTNIGNIDDQRRCLLAAGSDHPRLTRFLSDYSFLADRLQREMVQDSHNDRENANERLNFPWYKVQQLMDIAVWD